MNEIPCGVCRDLLPLVLDGVASPESCKLVERHLAHCPACRAMADREPMPPGNAEAAFAVFRKKLRLFWAMVLMLGLVWGLSLSGGGDLFYNIILMPALGALSYGLFRFRALLWMPPLVFGTHIVTNLAGLGDEVLDWHSLLLWSGIYCLLAGVGFAIAALLHFALRKEKIV